MTNAPAPTPTPPAQPVVAFALATVGGLNVVVKTMTFPNGSVQAIAFTQAQLQAQVGQLNAQYNGQLAGLNSMLALFPAQPTS